MTNFYQLIPSTNEVAIRQQRIWCNCLLLLPEEVRERTPQQQVERCNGNFVLGFSRLPYTGERFPFEGHIWEVIREPLQFPCRYKSRDKKKPAIVFTKHVGSYENDSDALVKLLEF